MVPNDIHTDHVLPRHVVLHDRMCPGSSRRSRGCGTDGGHRRRSKRWIRPAPKPWQGP